MNIVVLDGFTLNPGDLSWDSISSLGKLTVYDRSNIESEIIQRARQAEAILINKIEVSERIIQQLPNLKYIGVTATGFNVIDIEAAKEKNITVTNVPAYSVPSVAQHAFALLLELTNRVGLHAKSTAKGEWSRGTDWSYTKRPIVELADKTLGIIGLGNIGKKVADIALAMGMKVIATGPRKKSYRSVVWVKLEEIFKESDVISLHCPLTPNTKEIVNKKYLSLMKPTAYLINTSRGGLINEWDLATYLNKGKIAGAGLDVLTSEPPESDNPLLDARKCFVTPHNAWASKESRQRLLTCATQNLKAYIQGTPENVVS